MTSRIEGFLFRHRDRVLALWGVVAAAAVWPPRGAPWSALLLGCGFALRLWARAHIGPHSRGRSLEAPERCAGGPYRFLPHPLYAANLLVLSALAFVLAGPSLAALAIVSGPAALYVVLGSAESRHLRDAAPPVRTSPLPHAARKLRSEWASLLPPLVLWATLQVLAAP